MYLAGHEVPVPVVYLPRTTALRRAGQLGSAEPCCFFLSTYHITLTWPDLIYTVVRLLRSSQYFGPTSFPTFACLKLQSPGALVFDSPPSTLVSDKVSILVDNDLDVPRPLTAHRLAYSVECHCVIVSLRHSGKDSTRHLPWRRESRDAGRPCTRSLGSR